MTSERGSGVAGAPDTWRICAVVVTFHPDQGFSARAEKIRQQIDGLVIVDNGSTPPVQDWQLVQAPGPSVCVIQNPRNLGVATALNQGLEFAEAQGYTHALLFDQDTDPQEHMVSSMRRFAVGRTDMASIAVLGINLLDAATRKPWFRFPSGSATEVKTAITSGSLLPLAIARELGRFRDDFFIDHVDEEYCLRARASGYRVVVLHEPLAVHALGVPKVHRLPWRTIGTTNHSAVRRYYMTRNHILLAREYARREPRWVLQTLFARLKSFILMLFFDDDRVAKMRLMWRGVVDGLAGRTGELPAPRRR